jgi:hypothetical protein
MNLRRASLLAAPFALALTLQTNDADACGGCFVSQTENTQVSGHRMVLSVSMAETTLWDQITYEGDPGEFAWVLPIRGTVEVGLSSDALFETLEQATQVIVNSPTIQCPQGNCGNLASGGDSEGTGGGGGGGVTVLAQEVVGPYETVQLEANDPAALNTWLTDHGYSIPADVEPIITDYVEEGFGFLALRLVPGQGIDSMKPVRVTSAGAAATLPLRMVAAGTGAKTPISLWVIAEGRYEPANMPSFVITSDELVWDWDSSSSNYASLREQRFAETNGFGWLIESAQSTGTYLFDGLVDQAGWDPIGSGYGDDAGEGASEKAAEDRAKLVGNITSGNIWVTRMFGELTRPALADDLVVGAAADQTPVYNYLQADQETGTRPECPPPPTCGEDGPGDIVGGIFGFESDDDSLGSSSCASTSREARSRNLSSMLVGMSAIAALALVRRRRRR